MPAIFTAMTIDAVSRTAFAIIEEVRRQFREIKGLMQGKARPEYGKCVDICTNAALHNLLSPTLIAIIAPILVGIFFWKAGSRWVPTGFHCHRLCSGNYLGDAAAPGITLRSMLSLASLVVKNLKPTKQPSSVILLVIQ